MARPDLTIRGAGIFGLACAWEAARRGAKVRVMDPEGRREGEALLPHVRWVENAYHAAQGADVLVILTEWNEFRALDLAKLARKMATPRLADLRTIYNRDDALAAGFDTYVGVGR